GEVITLKYRRIVALPCDTTKTPGHFELGSSSRGSGGGIRTPDLWVMSPTSCRCSTPRRACGSPARPEGGGYPRRPRLPRSRLRSTLRRCAGSRPGSGWDRGEPARSRPRAPPTPRRRGARDDAMRTSRHMRHRPRTSRLALLPAPPRAPHENSRSQQRPTELAPPPWTRINSCAKAPRMTLLSLARAPPVSIGNRRRMCSLEHWDFRPRPLGRLGSSRLP